MTFSALPAGWLPPPALKLRGSEESSSHGNQAAATGGLVPFPGMHLLQRVLHPLVASDRGRHSARQDLARLHRNLQAAAGKQAEEALHDTMKKYQGQYLMLVEGSIPTDDGGIYCCIGGRTALDIVKEAAAGAKAIVCWGSCASNGCIQAANPNPTGRHADSQGHLRQADHQCAGLPADRRSHGRHDRPPAGLRPHSAARSAWPAQGVLLPPGSRQLLPPSELRRRPVRRKPGTTKTPKAATACTRWAAEDPSPTTHCGIMRWNNGVSFPIQSGHGCIGCSEANFWDNGPFYRHLPSFPGFGIETTADKVGLALGAATAAGIAAHAILTNIRKRKLIQQEIEESEPPAYEQ